MVSGGWNRGIKGKDSHSFGYKHTEEAKKKIAEASKGNTYKRNKGKITMKDGYKMIKRNGRDNRLHRLIWLRSNQLHRVPTGCVIHHCDGNKLNNSIGNLQLLDNATHTKLHKGGRKWQE